MRIAALALAGALILGGCGGDTDDEAAGTTTTASEPETEIVRVRVSASTSGLGGCTESTQRSGLDVGNGSRVTLEDGDGSVLGVGTMQLTEGAEICNWSAEIPDVPADLNFYTAVAGGEVATVSRSELEATNWTLAANIEVDGSITVLN